MRRLLFACLVAMLLSYAALLARAQVPNDALRACRNEVAAHYLDIPIANISVQPGSTNANGFTVNWTAAPPRGGRVAGFCVVSRQNTILRFETTGGPTPGSPSPGRPPGVGPQPPGRVQFSGTVTNRNAGRCLDVASSSRSPGGNVQIFRCNGGLNQRWDFISLGRNEFAIRNQNSGMMLDVTMASRANDANVQQFPWNGSGAQRWRMQGSQIINVNSGKCLDVAYQSRADGGNVNQWDCHRGASQSWQIPR